MIVQNEPTEDNETLDAKRWIESLIAETKIGRYSVFVYPSNITPTSAHPDEGSTSPGTLKSESEKL